MAASGKIVWVGRVLSGLTSFVFVFSGLMKFKGGPDIDQGFAHLGLPLSMRIPLGVLELACVVVYMIPATAVLGAVLLAGYIGGAILTHWRVGDPVVTQIVIGLLVWLGIYLRDSRLKELLPIRRNPAP
jgi:hypothetical protein